MTLKEKLIIYFYNREDYIEQQYNEQLQFYRYHKADEVDYLELAILKVRVDTYREIFNDIKLLMNMTDKTLDNIINEKYH